MQLVQADSSTHSGDGKEGRSHTRKKRRYVAATSVSGASQRCRPEDCSCGVNEEDLRVNRPERAFSGLALAARSTMHDDKHCSCCRGTWQQPDFVPAVAHVLRLAEAAEQRREQSEQLAVRLSALGSAWDDVLMLRHELVSTSSYPRDGAV
jgi:hypothetical protein